MNTITIINFMGLVLAFLLTSITMGFLCWIVYKIDETIFSAKIREDFRKSKLELEKELSQEERKELENEIQGLYVGRRELMEKRTYVRRYADIFLAITCIYWFLYGIWVLIPITR